jgi:hypothetical protein
LKAIAPGPEVPGYQAWGPLCRRRRIASTGREIPKALINSDEHREWQVYHAQPRFGLPRISRTDHGEPGAAVLRLAGVCFRLGRRPAPSPARANAARFDRPAVEFMRGGVGATDPSLFGSWFSSEKRRAWISAYIECAYTSLEQCRWSSSLA